MKRIIVLCVILTSFLLLGSMISVNSKNSTEKIQVTYKNISLLVNDKLVTSEQEPFIYEGRTFVPLRTIGEALNKTVNWDNTKNQVIITDITTPQLNTIASVTIKSFKFDPDMLTIKTGTTVIWTNEDSPAHNIKSDIFLSPVLATGESFSYTFNKAGTYNYVCGIHTSMTGTIIVK
jgi:plastocyanin